MDILMDLFGHTVVAFYGALVGILYPPKSPSWARAQKIGIGLLCAALVAWAVACATAMLFGWRTALWALVALGFGFVIAYLVVGNICLEFHERNREDAAGNP